MANVVVDWGVIMLPAPQLPRPLHTGAEGAGGLAVSRGLRILMVEDDPALSVMYQVRLEAAGYSVSVATHADDALRSIAQQPPFDLVFLDIGLPGMDGLSLLETIRSSKASEDMPVVILSNYNEPPMKRRGLSLGAMAYLVKSEITPSWLVSRIPDWTGT